MDKLIIKAEFERLCTESNFVTNSQKAQRGRDFEKLINRLLKENGLSPRTSFRPDGEEIDGSFIYEGKVYLLELKWQEQKMPASSIYAFKGKIEGKLIGTIGIFISMSGFSAECVDAVTLGKSLNTILVDQEDIMYCIENELSFKYLLEIKLRRAAEYGTIFYPIKNESKENSSKEAGDQSGSNTLPGLIIILESSSDQIMVEHLADKILKVAGIKRNLMYGVAGGKSSIGRFANAVYDFREASTDDGLNDPKSDDYTDAKVLILVDEDGDSETTEWLIKKDLDPDVPATIIMINPAIEFWFQQFDIHEKSDLIKFAEKNGVSYGDAINQLLKEINIDQLMKSNPSFRRFNDALIQ